MNIVLLAGGVGGAKLAEGLAALVPPEQLTIIGNTGDDFTHCGLPISPDLDTVMYTLAGVANGETGWGRVGESWRTISEVANLGGPDWFRLGDLDLATHLTRAHLLAQGGHLTQVTRQLCQQLGVQHPLLPMSNQAAPTLVETDEGILPFQTWFVQKRWQPVVRQIILPENVQATHAAAAALEKADLILIAPSNPFVSINPILNVYPIRELLADSAGMVMAVTPIIAGEAVKGPTAKMMREMNLPVTPESIVLFYEGLIDAFVYDVQDKGVLDHLDIPHLCTNTWMQTREDRLRLAQEILTFGQSFSR
ncbi:MAG: 2-phospho-L-lactate transferase [Chloroflexi bacterium]|nr:2-phospho-L-lactate transferase [Chloroflexota bacterium]